MKTLFFLSIIISLCLPIHVSARETTNQKYEKIAIIGQQILKAKSIESRSALIQSIKTKYTFVPSVWSLIPTYDITPKYRPYIQHYKLSCEIAAAKMIMESLWIRVSEDDIFYRIPVFSWSLDETGIWWNPEQEFVGNINGSQYSKTGYGVYEAPISSYFEKQWFQTIIINAKNYQKGMSAHKHLITLLQSIQKWHHVILWGDYCTHVDYEDGLLFDTTYKTLLKLFPIAAKNSCERSSDERIFSWKTRDGAMIKWLSWEHAFLLLGYIGNINRPSHIIVWDTDTWRHIFPYNEWMRKWSLLEFRSLIVQEK